MEPIVVEGRRSAMKLTAYVLLALLTVSGCGKARVQELSASPGSGASASGTPTAGPSASPSAGRPQPSVGRTATPKASATTATPNATVTSGSASAGPGTVTSPTPTSPRPTPQPSAGTVTVTDDDSGITVRLAVGQHLRVRLTKGSWDPPTSSQTNVVARRSSTGGYPSDQPVDAVFEATARGAADVTAQSDAACFHTEPHCMMAIQQWSVHVEVR